MSWGTTQLSHLVPPLTLRTHQVSMRRLVSVLVVDPGRTLLDCKMILKEISNSLRIHYLYPNVHTYHKKF